MGLYRDVLTVQLGAGEALINVDLVAEVTKLASETSQAQTIHCIEQIEKVRYRMDRNVREDLLLNSLTVSLRRKATK
jgi:DNA polymerase-3 subunit delta'